MSSPREIVRLKITLDHVKPTVMRRIEVPADVKLDTLHEMIQAIMPWGDRYPYEFRLRGTYWGIPLPRGYDLGYPNVDSRKTRLLELLSQPDVKMLHYTYNPIDDWQHTIKVERRFSAELWDAFPRLVDAKGRCPPEDVGYAEYLKAMADPLHPRHAELTKWLGRRDPNEIDRSAMEAALATFAETPQRARRRPKPKAA